MNTYKYNDCIDNAMQFIEEFQLMNPTLWKRFVTQFRDHTDTNNEWRGEYWGKMMRGACFVYAYTQNPQLYAILADTVRDMMTCHAEDGRISTYPQDREFDGWDLWSRKYVLLGMEYFLEICKDDELTQQIIASMRKQVDYIMKHVGPGKKDINQASRNWRGLNSSSILEPIVRLYNLTQETSYLDFAKYIVDLGGTEIVNIFDLAYEDDFAPYQYPVTKAYEMTSCFEGLLEYYLITGNERYKTAIVNYANKILETDFTVIGCCGCTHELFDHSTVRQANTTNDTIMQETCVTVTLMKFFYRVHLLTGDPRYVDAFETSLYNAYLGAINTNKISDPSIIEEHPDWILEPLPFDSYSPLTAGLRGTKIGGLQRMPDNHYYGCCACIGAAGIGLAPKMQIVHMKDALAINLYMNGIVQTQTPAGAPLTLQLDTAYPKAGAIHIALKMNTAEAFTLKLRNPAWSYTTTACLNGTEVPVSDGYIEIHRSWQDGDLIDLVLDMRTEALRPIPYGSTIIMNNVVWAANYIIPTYDHEDPLAKHHIALRRGPLMLAQENRLGYSVDTPISVSVQEDGYVDVVLPETDTAPYEHIVEVQIPLEDGTLMTVTDYASAGKLWNEESKMAVWMLTR